DASPPSSAPEPALVAVSAHGLTADQVARRAALTSYSVASAREALVAARANVVHAATLFAPRLTGTARYARLSDFLMPAIGGESGTLVGTMAPPGTTNPQTVSLPVLRFTNVLDNYYFSANLLVPVTDYFLRINYGYHAATKNEEAARFDAVVAE